MPYTPASSPHASVPLGQRARTGQQSDAVATAPGTAGTGGTGGEAAFIPWGDLYRSEPLQALEALLPANRAMAH